MKGSHFVAAFGAAILLPLMLATPAAQANESFTGTLEASDAPARIHKPNYDTQACGSEGDQSVTLPHDEVRFVSQSSGPRRLVVRNTGRITNTGLFVYRNGVCVAADVDPRDPSTTEPSGTVDVANVTFEVGDQVVVQIAANLTDGPVPWSLSVEQPGTANAAATGKGTRYVSLPYQVACVGGVGFATLTKKLVKHVDDVRSVTFRAGGTKLRKLAGAKLEKAARKAKKGKPVLLVGVPAGTTSLSVVVKLENGKKAAAARPYSVC